MCYRYLQNCNLKAFPEDIGTMSNLADLYVVEKPSIHSSIYCFIS